MNQACLLTAWKLTAWIRIEMTIWPSNGVRTFRDTRFAVGRFRHSPGNGPVHPMKMAMGNINARSMNRNWKSPKFDADA